jgi:hypothetical protein
MNAKIPTLLTAALALLLAGATAAADTGGDTLRFQVLLDDRPIGTHEFHIAGDRDRRTVETRARFDVRVLFVPVFRYSHDNTEIWADGCVQRLDSQTDSNGTSYRVSLERDDRGYRIATLDRSVDDAAACINTFAYWDPAFLQQSRLLNSQTGELIEVRVEPLGVVELDWPGVEIPVEGFRIVSESDGVDISVYYGEADRRWVALESRLESGRLMRYVPSVDLRHASGRGATGEG